MKAVLLLISIFSAMLSYAADSEKQWQAGAGFVKAPYGQGVSLELLLPYFWSKEYTDQNKKLGVRTSLGWEDIWTYNVMTDDDGNFTRASYTMLSVNFKFTTTFANGNFSFVELGYADFLGTEEFSDENISGTVAGLGYAILLGTHKKGDQNYNYLGFVRFRHIFFTDEAKKASAEPEVFGGGYMTFGTIANF